MSFLQEFAASFVSVETCSPRERKPYAAVVSGLALAAALVSLLSASAAGAVTIGSGYSAMWFRPGTQRRRSAAGNPRH